MAMITPYKYAFPRVVARSILRNISFRILVSTGDFILGKRLVSMRRTFVSRGKVYHVRLIIAFLIYFSIMRPVISWGRIILATIALAFSIMCWHGPSPTFQAKPATMIVKLWTHLLMSISAVLYRIKAFLIGKNRRNYLFFSVNII